MLTLAAAILWFHFHNSQITTSQPQNSTTNAPVVAIATNQPVANSSKPQMIANGNSSVTNNLTDIAAKYNQGLIGKDQAIQATILAENEKPQDFYGKIIDQYGQPIAGVDVTGNLMLVQGWDSDEKINRYKTLSDENGLFQFTGLKGSQLGVTVSKNGFVMNSHNGSYKVPESGQISPDNRVVLTMWKIRGNEPLVQSAISANLSPEGNTVAFDVLTGKQTPDGDLKITFSRFPPKVKPGLVHPYDWQFKIEIANGGLIQENDSYPYWAPESGYQSSFAFEISSNSVPWQNQFEQNFYIKNSTGKFGLMKFLIYSASRPPQIQINFTINPSGSQNLEPDFSK